MNVTGEVAVSVFVIVSVALYVHLRFSGVISRMEERVLAKMNKRAKK